MLQKYHPLWMNIHVNHPNEISAELADAATGSHGRVSRWATRLCC